MSIDIPGFNCPELSESDNKYVKKLYSINYADQNISKYFLLYSCF